MILLCFLLQAARSCLTLCNPMDYILHEILQPLWSGQPSLLQGIFPTQGSNPGLPYCRWILYQLSHQGSPLLPYCIEQLVLELLLLSLSVNKTAFEWTDVKTLYQFSIAAITSYQKFIKERKFIILWLCRSEVWVGICGFFVPGLR